MSRPQESLHTNSLDASGFSTSQQTKQTNHVLCLRRHGSIDALAMVCLLCFCLTESAAYAGLPLRSQVLAKGAEDLVHSWVPRPAALSSHAAKGLLSARYPGYPGLFTGRCLGKFSGATPICHTLVP